MKKLNQQGFFTPVNILLMVLILAVIGFVGYRVLLGNQETAEPVATGVQESPPEIDEATEGNKEVLFEVEPSVALMKVEDLTQLPEETPQSFIEYMTSILEENLPDPQTGCSSFYSVDLISAVNIRGGVASTAASSIDEIATTETDPTTCGSGAKAIWYFDQNTESWSFIGSQSLLDCTELTKEDAPVYVEFMDVCVPEGDPATVEPISNPNGSIYDAEL